MVVEDDPTIRYLLGFVLEQNGWEMQAFDDGEKALAALAQGPVADAVLLDVVLPGMDGLSLLERLRALPAWRTVPVMMLTGQGDEALVTRALAAGANDYLGKPFDFSELIDRLARIAAAQA
ncbi:response regulator [Ramlibacter rhizophilus]|uniref:Response regulator n=1 Tax=Ramlibacter rhizophilus TaxID=1781167 RepID=A0A4Z0BYA8_9BURK|nr:response regulator [Ramlibacter rhizophilus]